MYLVNVKRDWVISLVWTGKRTRNFCLFIWPNDLRIKPNKPCGPTDKIDLLLLTILAFNSWDQCCVFWERKVVLQILVKETNLQWNLTELVNSFLFVNNFCTLFCEHNSKNPVKVFRVSGTATGDSRNAIVHHTCPPR